MAGPSSRIVNQPGRPTTPAGSADDGIPGDERLNVAPSGMEHHLMLATDRITDEAQQHGFCVVT
jgi:hypothetical protein